MTPACRRVLGTGSIVVLSACALHAQDRAATVPGMKVLLENARVRVQYHDVAVGETTPMHSHPAYVAYVFGPYTGKAILRVGMRAILLRCPFPKAEATPRACVRAWVAPTICSPGGKR